MVGYIAAGILGLAVLALIIAWAHAIANSDGRCDPGEDCESCFFPCEGHNRKRQK